MYTRARARVSSQIRFCARAERRLQVQAGDATRELRGRAVSRPGRVSARREPCDRAVSGEHARGGAGEILAF